MITRMSQSELNIAVLGFGTVGAGVVKMLLHNGDLLTKRTGKKLTLKYVADLDIKKDRGVKVPKNILTTDALRAVNDPAVDIVVEVIGGVQPAKKFIEAALKNKKQVITSNKEVIAKYGRAFIALAAQQQVNILFEASVGGGIPIINALTKALAGNNIRRIYGIVNGTTNYILTKMYRENTELDIALKEAQALGYAEADPTNDLDGHDVVYKLSILAGIAFNSHFNYQDIYREGIRGLSTVDIALAREFGYVIKLLAIGIAREAQQVELRVHPVMVPQKHPLATVNDSFNAVFVEGDCVGETMFYGRGAGELPTASAVIGDIVDLALHYEMGGTNPALHFNFMQKKIVPSGAISSEFFIRLQVKDEPGVLAAVSKICANNRVSIKTVQQKDANGVAHLVIITHLVKEAALQKAIKQIGALRQVLEVSSVIRAGL
ncbi:homoserine dehydrogenase [Candidatus Termititenax persephonae]|uniref:Homoserine dehydrogenase n=1 Tax=Candidatus Termititenax persephonae TaxID=2218525 RepID=A0A388TEA6_9BACT|nr:homoserine dehydrogenase [Candidatus Termititenax persephonae]